MNDQSPPLMPSRHHISKIARRTMSKSWDDSIFSESAQAAFWCALSLPPLLLGMLGSLAYIAPIFGPDTLPAIQEQFISTAGRFFSRKIAENIPDSWVNVLAFGYYPVLFLGLVVAMTFLYRVSLPKPLPSHRLVIGSVLATVVFLIATFGLRVYLTWI